jgi:hypothetical protein
VAEQLTVVVPSGKVEPEAGEQVAARAPSTISLADAEKLIVAPEGPVASTVMLAGTFTVGGVVSTTDTLKLALPVFPAASVAEQLTVTVPRAKVEPEEGEQLGVIAPSTRSLAEAVKETAAPEGPVASTTLFAGTVTTGAVVSRTVTLKPPEAVLPAESAAEQLTVVVPSGKVEPEAGEQLGVTAPSTMSLAEAV